MKRVLIGAIFLSSICGLVSCGFMQASFDKDSGASLIPEEMFYHTQGSCQNGDLAFVALSGTGMMLWTDPDQVLYAQGKIYLSKDGSYSFTYQEFTPAALSYETTFQSTYSVDEASGIISLKDLGTARIVQRDSRNALELSFERDINSPLLKDQVVDFRIWDFKDGLDISREDYCQY